MGNIFGAVRSFTAGLYLQVFSSDTIIISYTVVMYRSLKHSCNYLLIYITFFIGRLLGALQKMTFDVISAFLGMNCNFFEK